jgi:hypothetical protein
VVEVETGPVVGDIGSAVVPVVGSGSPLVEVVVVEVETEGSDVAGCPVMEAVVPSVSVPIGDCCSLHAADPSATVRVKRANERMRPNSWIFRRERVDACGLPRSPVQALDSHIGSSLRRICAQVGKKRGSGWGLAGRVEKVRGRRNIGYDAW